MRILLLLLLVLLVACFATNPSKEDHLERLEEVAKEEAGSGPLGGALAGELAGELLKAFQGRLKWNNYFVCSTLSKDEEILTLGVLGQVILLQRKDS